MRAHQKKPCKECPFRRASMPGWLGAGSPERFALAILAAVVFAEMDEA